MLVRASKLLLHWIRNPRGDRTLGRKGLVKVATGREYSMDWEGLMWEKMLG